MPAGNERHGTFGSTTVVGPPGRDVFINGNYRRPAGETNEPLLVEMGGNRFETLDEERRIDSRADGTVTQDQPNITVTLQAVVPPEPTRASPKRAGAPKRAAKPTRGT